MTWKRTKPRTLEATDGDLPVHQKLARLLPGTKYRYRLVAENADGVTKGAHQRFKTKG